jgi:hypothetical protein
MGLILEGQVTMGAKLTGAGSAASLFKTGEVAVASLVKDWMDTLCKLPLGHVGVESLRRGRCRAERREKWKIECNKSLKT